jgi:hypothetical protein
VDAFIEYYLGTGRQLAEEVGYVPLPEASAAAARKRYVDRVVGPSQG